MRTTPSAARLSTRPTSSCWISSCRQCPGHELLAELRRHPLTTHIPIVIATGATPTEAERRELGQRASAILLKAELSRHTLPDIVRTALGRAI